MPTQGSGMGLGMRSHCAAIGHAVCLRNAPTLPTFGHGHGGAMAWPTYGGAWALHRAKVGSGANALR